MSKFKPGQSGNPSGRPAGSPNRTTEEVRKLLQTFIEGKLPELETIWQALDAKEKISFIDRLLKHCLPAQTKYEISEVNHEIPKVVFE